EWNGWLTDSIWVHVTPFDDTGTLVRETFLDPELPGWIHSGAPPTLSSEGPLFGSLTISPGPFTLGDGLQPMILHGARGHTLPGGGTVEVEVWLPAADGITEELLVLCLLQWTDNVPPVEAVLRTMAMPHGTALDDPDSLEQKACLRYPAREGGRQTPGKLDLRTHRAFPGIHLSPGDEGLPRDTWIHLALTLRPDGRVVAHADRVPLGEAPARLKLPSDGEWYIFLAGAVDPAEGGGGLVLRNLSLWEGTRYGGPGPTYP
ncbi:MAG: hypothetical protein EA352_08735, partial [Gemmatimonadales bacterium]